MSQITFIVIEFSNLDVIVLRQSSQNKVKAVMLFVATICLKTRLMCYVVREVS